MGGEVVGVRFTTIIALVGAPIAACATTSIVWALTLTAFGGIRLGVAVFFGSLVLSGAVALPVTIICGPFVYLHFVKRDVRSQKAYVLAGINAALGAALLAFAVVAVINDLLYAFMRALMLVVYGTPIGALTGLYGWFIRRPDRDASPLPNGGER